MHSSALTTKGQITIPADIRKQLGFHPGDKIGFTVENNHVILYLKESNIEAAFGICHPKTSVSLTEIDKAIKERGGNASD